MSIHVCNDFVSKRPIFINSKHVVCWYMDIDSGANVIELVNGTKLSLETPISELERWFLREDGLDQNAGVVRS